MTRPDHSLAAVQCSRCKLSFNVLLDVVCPICVAKQRAVEAKPARAGNKTRQGSH